MSASPQNNAASAILHFSRDEYAARVERAAGALREHALDGILLFAPESHYFLCGYDTFGFAMFQCLIITADGDLQLFTRAPTCARHNRRRPWTTTGFTSGWIAKAWIPPSNCRR